MKLDPPQFRTEKLDLREIFYGVDAGLTAKLLLGAGLWSVVANKALEGSLPATGTAAKVVCGKLVSVFAELWVEDLAKSGDQIKRTMKKSPINAGTAIPRI